MALTPGTTVYNGVNPRLIVTFQHAVVPLSWKHPSKPSTEGIMTFSVDPPQNIEVHVMNGAPNYDVERIVHMPVGPRHMVMVKAGQFLRVMGASGGESMSWPAVLQQLPFPTDLHLSWSIQL